MTYVIDIDGTICTPAIGGGYLSSLPFYDRIQKINKLYDNGDIIIYCTARGMGRNNNNPEQAIIQFFEMTEKQLASWGVKYHKLFLGKPAGDIYIDDKGKNADDFFREDNEQ